MRRDYGKYYQALITLVAKIDCDAANYLLHVAPIMSRRHTGNHYTAMCGNAPLRTAFAWCKTPQGHKYWQAIDRILGPDKYWMEDDDE